MDLSLPENCYCFIDKNHINFVLLYRECIPMSSGKANDPSSLIHHDKYNSAEPSTQGSWFDGCTSGGGSLDWSSIIVNSSSLSVLVLVFFVVVIGGGGGGGGRG